MHYYMNKSQNWIKAAEYHDFIISRIDQDYHEYAKTYFEDQKFLKLFLKINKTGGASLKMQEKSLRVIN